MVSEKDPSPRSRGVYAVDMGWTPVCKFAVAVEGGAFVTGRPNQAVVELSLPEAIPDATSLRVEFTSRLRTISRDSNGETSSQGNPFPTAPIYIPLPQGLTAGTHRFPFVIDIPAQVAPAVRLHGMDLVHTMQVELDVPWAVDPARACPLSSCPRRFMERARGDQYTSGREIFLATSRSS
jgi:hypothetical protein